MMNYSYSYVHIQILEDHTIATFIFIYNFVKVLAVLILEGSHEIHSIIIIIRSKHLIKIIYTAYQENVEDENF